jgi:hypothetical protein
MVQSLRKSLKIGDPIFDEEKELRMLDEKYGHLVKEEILGEFKH